jgi:hypothetical protein
MNHDTENYLPISKMALFLRKRKVPHGTAETAVIYMKVAKHQKNARLVNTPRRITNY